MVKSFSDFISTAFCNNFSNIAAAVATTTEANVVTIQIARKPAGSSSLSCVNLMINPVTTTKLLNTIAQYLMFRKVLTDIIENTLLSVWH